MLTDAELEAMERRAREAVERRAATPHFSMGCYFGKAKGVDFVCATGHWYGTGDVDADLKQASEDRNFFRSAYEDVPALVAEVRRLRAERATARMGPEQWPGLDHESRLRLLQACQSVGVDVHNQWLSDAATEAITRLEAEVRRLKPAWTSTPPAVAGKYWNRPGPHGPQPYDVDDIRVRDGVAVAWDEIDHQWVPLAQYYGGLIGEWAGPLVPPGEKT